MAQNRAKKLLLQCLHLRRHWSNSFSPRRFFFLFFSTQPQCLAPAGQSWAEAGSGVWSWSSPASSAGAGAGPRGSGPREGARRVVGLRLDTEAGLRGGATACGLPEVLLPERSVMHGRVLAALLGPEERVLQHPACAARQVQAARNPRPAPPLPPRQLPPRRPAFQQPARGGARAAAPSATPGT